MVNAALLPKWVFLGFLLGSSRRAGARAIAASRPVAGALLPSLRPRYHLSRDDVSAGPGAGSDSRVCWGEGTG